MKKYSPLLKTFKFALICGAVLTPLNHAEAGWNKMVDELKGTGEAHLARLRLLCDSKFDQEIIPEKWLARAGQLSSVNSITPLTLENVKLHLGDRGQYKKAKPKAGAGAAVPATRVASTPSNNNTTAEDPHTARLKRHIASLETALKVAQTKNEREDAQKRLLQLRAELNGETPANTNRPSAAVPASGNRATTKSKDGLFEQIMALETALRCADTDHEKTHYTEMLAQLRAAYDAEVTETAASPSTSNIRPVKPPAVAPRTTLTEQERRDLVRSRLRERDREHAHGAASAVQRATENVQAASHRPVVRAVGRHQEIARHIQLLPGSIVLWDIDGTLYHKRAQLDAEHATPDICTKLQRFYNEVGDKFGDDAMYELMGARENAPYKTEDDLPGLLKSLSDAGVILIPFTARSDKEAASTEAQLKAFGYDFTLLNKGKRALPVDFYEAIKVVNNMIFGKEGHTYAGRKDLALQALLGRLQQDGWNVPAVAMVEDTDANIYQMNDLIKESPYPLHLIHYSGGKVFDTAEKVKAFYRRTVANFGRYEAIFNKHFR